jgi:hypothetical protein
MTDPAAHTKLARRRRTNVAGGRQHKHEVKVTQDEAARLAVKAAEQHVTVPRLLVESALSGDGETSTQRRDAMSELFAIRRQLVGVARNVNQLARLGNTDRRTPVGTAAALERIHVVVDKVDGAIDGLAGS